jgi:hypothetical protein
VISIDRGLLESNLFPVLTTACRSISIAADLPSRRQPRWEAHGVREDIDSRFVDALRLFFDAGRPALCCAESRLSAFLSALEVFMIGKPIALLKEVPTQRMFTSAAAAQYLGISLNTLFAITDEGQLKAYVFRHRRAYRLEDLDRLIESQKEWKVYPQGNRKGRTE